MSKNGSESTAAVLPPAVGSLAVAAGMLAMLGTFRPAAALGVRAGLVVSELLLAAPGLLAFAFYGIPLAQGLRLRRISGGAVGLSLLSGACFWVASLGLLELQSAFWPPEADYIELFRKLHEALQPRHPLDAALSVAAIAVVPAVCEEVLIRGIVLPSLLASLGGAGAVGASALLFGLIHLDPYRFPFTFAAGLGLGALRLLSGSLVPSVLAHALLNTITFAAALVLADASGLEAAHPWLGAALLVAGFAASVALLRRFRPVDPPEAAA